MSTVVAASANLHAQPKTDTGVPNGKLAMWVFLASEVMFFTGLLGALVVLWLSHPNWPGPEGHLSVAKGTLNTFVLLCSSASIVLALAADHSGNRAKMRYWLTATILLGALFIGIKGTEYAEKLSHGIVPSTNVFWSCYYVLTGFHAVHVIGGIIFNVVVLAYSYRDSWWAKRGHRLELAGLYWHFVDIVWLFLFPLLYLFQ